MTRTRCAVREVRRRVGARARVAGTQTRCWLAVFLGTARETLASSPLVRHPACENFGKTTRKNASTHTTGLGDVGHAFLRHRGRGGKPPRLGEPGARGGAQRRRARQNPKRQGGGVARVHPQSAPGRRKKEERRRRGAWGRLREATRELERVGLGETGATETSHRGRGRTVRRPGRPRGRRGRGRRRARGLGWGLGREKSGGERWRARVFYPPGGREAVHEQSGEETPEEAADARRGVGRGGARRARERTKKKNKRARGRRREEKRRRAA